MLSEKLAPLPLHSGDQFLVVDGYPQPKVFDRDGRELGEFDKGDMYIRDLKNTKGWGGGAI